MESLAADFAALATSSPSLVETCDDDSLRLILWIVSGERGKPKVGFIDGAAACALLRLAPVCRGFSQIVRSYVPEDKQAELKQTHMHLTLQDAFQSSEELPWTAETVLHVSTMDVARYLAEEATEVLREHTHFPVPVPAWLGTRVGRLLLSGGIDKLRERIKRAPSKKGRVQFEEITAAYTLLIETKREAGLLFDAEKVLRLHSTCGRGMCAQLLHTLLISRNSLHMCGNLIAREKDQLSRLRAIEVDEFGASEASVEHALLNALLRKALLRATDGGFFSGMLHVLKIKSLVKDKDAYRAWRSTIGAEHPLIAVHVDPSKGSRWLAIPGNAEKVAEETARKLEKAENEVPLTLTPFEGVRSNLRL
jgi:hypothetical protein